MPHLESLGVNEGIAIDSLVHFISVCGAISPFSCLSISLETVLTCSVPEKVLALNRKRNYLRILWKEATCTWPPVSIVHKRPLSFSDFDCLQEHWLGLSRREYSPFVPMTIQRLLSLVFGSRNAHCNWSRKRWPEQVPKMKKICKP